MPKGIYQVPFAVNEEVLSYAPGTAEREELLSTYKKCTMKRLKSSIHWG